MKIYGLKEHQKRLARMGGPALRAIVGAELSRGCVEMADTMRHSIMDGAVSGPGHVRSIPGQPPKADTHYLDQSIQAVRGQGGSGLSLNYRVEINDPAAAPLEWGTSDMAERPFIRPAAAKWRRILPNRIGVTLSRMVRG